MTALEIKVLLLDHCQQQVQKRYDKIKQSIASIEESLKEESKSTSGDKHHTGRAMLHIDRENAGRQLMEIEKLLAIINKIDVHKHSDYVRLGSLVHTDKFNYFIGLSIGNVKIDTKDYICVAFNSPVGMLLSGKTSGEKFSFNDIEYEITMVQ